MLVSRKNLARSHPFDNSKIKCDNLPSSDEGQNYVSRYDYLLTVGMTLCCNDVTMLTERDTSVDQTLLIEDVIFIR